MTLTTIAARNAITESYWVPTKDADPRARDIFHRHYSYRRYKDGRNPAKFVGPGEYLALMTTNCDALFVWRKMPSGGLDHQDGVGCSVFRNESPILSSELIADAMRWAWDRWPGERLYTYVDPRKIRSSNPGYCFRCAGWRPCGVTKRRRLAILEVYP